MKCGWGEIMKLFQHKKINYKCKECGYIDIKEKNWKTRTIKIIKTIFLSLFIATSILGTLGVANIIIVNVYESPDDVISIGQSMAFIRNIQNKFQSNEKQEILKNYTDEIVKDCETELCKVEFIFEKLILFEYKYENATNLDPLKTWDNKEGDCDMMSYLYMSMLKTRNIKSYMDCSITHCWNIVYLNDTKFKVDIVNWQWEKLK